MNQRTIRVLEPTPTEPIMKRFLQNLIESTKSPAAQPTSKANLSLEPLETRWSPSSLKLTTASRIEPISSDTTVLVKTVSPSDQDGILIGL
jgi:hypothetical protein